MILHIEIADELFDLYEKKFGGGRIYISNMEEPAEYIAEVARVFCNKSNGDGVIEEMADTIIGMMHLLKKLGRQADLNPMIERKLSKHLPE